MGRGQGERATWMVAEEGSVDEQLENLNRRVVSLFQQGRYAAAVPLAEQALAICLRVLGDDHPDTAGSLNNLGLLLQAQGDYAGARPHFEQALAICLRVLGEDHPNTATSL